MFRICWIVLVSFGCEDLCWDLNRNFFGEIFFVLDLCLLICLRFGGVELLCLVEWFVVG